MRRKIYIALTMLMIIAVSITGFLTMSFFRGNYIDNVQERLISNSYLIADFIEDHKEMDYNEKAKSMAREIKARITFIDKDGVVIGDSDVALKDLDNHRDREEILEAEKTQEVGISKRYSNSTGYDMLYVAIPFKKAAHKIAFIRLSVPLEQLEEFNAVLFKNITISILIGLIIASIIGYRYISTITEPIKDLTEVTKNISEGNYHNRININASDELGLLGNSFNKMSEKLEETIDKLTDEKTNMEAILSSIDSGVVAVDNNKRVIFLNEVAIGWLNINEQNIEGKNIMDIIKEEHFGVEIYNVLENKKDKKYDFEITKPYYRSYQMNTNPIMLKNEPNRRIGTLMVIRDLTEVRKLERMRKDFVGNVSHELKTPITSIQGFVETLKSGAAENSEIRDKFLGIIDIEAKRLTSLTEDLLSLSEIESTYQIPNPEKINISRCVGEISDLLKPIAEKKQVKMEYNIDEDIPNISGKSSWFKQMLTNLIENAIKYNSEGGKVNVKAYRAYNQVVIEIKDTGIGIEEEHLPRLFERFYRVDKARSRKVGGTGLGLAIVKHIAIIFDGTVDVESEIGVGTKFIVKIPFNA